MQTTISSKSLRPTWVEALIFAPAFFLAFVFEISGDVVPGNALAKSGIPIPLPGNFGSIPNFQPKLLPMELFLIYVGLITLAQLRKWPRPKLLPWLAWLTAGLLTFCLIRAAPDFRANPMLVIRSSAFGWYLALPLMILLYPIPSRRWEVFFQALYVFSFCYFVIHLLFPFFSGVPGNFMVLIDLGLMLALAFAFTSSRTWPARLVLATLGFFLVLLYFGNIQRTTLLGLLVGLFLLGISQLFRGRFPRPQWARMGWLVPGMLLCLSLEGAMHLLTPAPVSAPPPPAVATAPVEFSPEENSFHKSELGGHGMEKFRTYLWGDALDEFKSSPWIGIGFLRPVVYRIYSGQGKFLDNSGSYEYRYKSDYVNTSPPLAGPHNSYLNALARLGFLGLGFLALHLVAVWIFLIHKYYACFFILLAQMLYAFFNVGLEGPIHSFLLLLLIGVALKASLEDRIQA